MEEREEIKLKILLLVILSIPIAISFWFILSVNKVYAADSIQFYTSGGSNLIQCDNCTTYNSLNTFRRKNDINYSYTYQNNTDLNIQFNTILNVTTTSDAVINIGNPTILVANGWLTYDIGSYCTQVLGTQTNTNIDNNKRLKTYNYAYSCQIPNYGGNFPNYNNLKVEYTLTGNYIKWETIDNGFQVTSTPYQQDNSGVINSASSNIMNNDNKNTQQVIENQNKNTQSIIDNQNANSEAQIDKIDETFNVCETYAFDETKNIAIYRKRLTNTGDIIDSQNYNLSEYTPVNKGKTYRYYPRNTTNYIYCLYDKNKRLLSCNDVFSVTEITPTQDGYIRYNAEKSEINFTGEYCYNRLDGSTEPNESKYNDEKEQEYLEKEEDLLDLYNSDQLDIIDLTIDTDGSNWVWDRITQFLNTNQYIRLMFISILSLGIIKLVLAR